MKKQHFMRAFSLILTVSMVFGVFGVLSTPISAESEIEPLIWSFEEAPATTTNGIDKYDGGFWMYNKENTNASQYGNYHYDADNKVAVVEPATKNGAHGGITSNRFFSLRPSKSATAPTTDRPVMIVTYRTDAAAIDTAKPMLTFAGWLGNNGHVVLEDDMTASNGEWVISAPVNLEENVIGNVEGTDTPLARFNKAAQCLLQMSYSDGTAVSEDTTFEIKEIAFFATVEDANKYYTDPLIIDMTTQTSAQKSLRFYTCSESDLVGVTHSFGTNVGNYLFDESFGAFSVKRSEKSALGSRWRMPVMFNSNVDESYRLAECQTYMVVTYKTNAVSDTAIPMEINRYNAYSTDYVTLTSDVTVSEGKWTRTEPVSILTAETERANNLFYRLYDANNHDFISIKFPDSVGDETYFYVKEIAFFDSVTEAEEYFAENPLIDESIEWTVTVTAPEELGTVNTSEITAVNGTKLLPLLDGAVTPNTGYTVSGYTVDGVAVDSNTTVEADITVEAVIEIIPFDMYFISAAQYAVLADNTKIAVIKSDANEVTYTYDGKDFVYSEKLGGYAAIVDADITADDIIADASVSDEAAVEIVYDGDVSGDGNVRSSDAALVNRMLHDPNGSYSDMARLRADVMVGNTVSVTTADVYFALRAAIGLSTDADDIPSTPIVLNGINVPMTSLAEAVNYFSVYTSTDVPNGSGHSYGTGVGEYAFDQLEQALRIKRSEVKSTGAYYRYFLKARSGVSYVGYPWIVVTYRTNAETSAEMYISNNATGASLTLESDVTRSGGEYVYTSPVNMDDGVSGLYTRFSNGSHIALGIKLPYDTPDDVYFYIKDVSFFETEKDAYNYINNVSLPEAVSYSYFPLTDYSTAAEKLTIYATDDVPEGATHSYGAAAGNYAFDASKSALLLKYSTSGYMGGNYRFHFRTNAKNMVGDNESWMVVAYRTNAADNVAMTFGNNNVGADKVILEADISVSDDKWVYSTPVNIDTDVAEADLFYRVLNTSHNALVVQLPSNTPDDVYFYIRGIYFFSSKEFAEHYMELNNLYGGLPEELWVEPAAISFESAEKTAVNATITSGSVEYTDDGALLTDSVSPQFNSAGYVLGGHVYAAVYYKSSDEGTLYFNGTEIASNTAISGGEWRLSESVELTDEEIEAFYTGTANTISYVGDGELYIGEVVLLSAPKQGDTDVMWEDETVPSLDVITWDLSSEAALKASGGAIVGSTSATYAFDSFDGEDCLHIERGTDYAHGNYRVYLKNTSSALTADYRYMRVTYYVDGMDSDTGAYFKFTNTSESDANAITWDNIYENGGKWTVSQVFDLKQYYRIQLPESDPDYNVANRLESMGNLCLGLVNAPEGLDIYIKDISFYETKAQAYNEVGDTPTPRYLDAELGKFTVTTVYEGDDLGEWTYEKYKGFTVTDAGNANYGGNYRMMYRFVAMDTIGFNKYMRVAYKADNGSATDTVSLVTQSPKTGDIAVLVKDVENTNGEWVLSDVALLTKDLYDRLGGSGSYDTNQYEKLFHKHNALAFTNTAPDAEYGIYNLYFFDNFEDAYNFTMPEMEEAPVSEFTVGSTAYVGEIAVNTGVDASLGENNYKIYVENDSIYAVGGSEDAAAFAESVAMNRVLGYDTLKDILNVTVADDFVLEGTYPTAEPSDEISLKYDDYYTFDKEVALVDSTEITSTSVITGEADTSVLKRIDGETFAASAIGTGTVYFTDGTSVSVTVTSAPISLLFIAGQSNGEGNCGSASQSIRNTPGQVYSTYACPGQRYISAVLGSGFTAGMDALTAYNGGSFVAKSLTSDISHVGADLTYTLDSLTEGGFGKGGIDSAVAYEWHKLTGDKVWVINVAHSGSGIASWEPGTAKSDNNFWQAVNVIGKAEATLQDEIAAGHYTLSNMGYFWLQGCSNKNTSGDSYTSSFKNMHNGFVSELAFDHDLDESTPERTVEFGGILLVRSSYENNTARDFEMNGPRLSQYYLGNSAEGELADIYLASNVGDIFKSDSAVASYFTEMYGTDANFKADNNVTYAMPTTVKEVHPDIHYRQSGYNEIGRDAARNMVYQLGLETPDTTEDVTITILDANGVELDTSNGITLASGASVTLVPVVAPRYAAGDVSFAIDGNVSVKNHYQFTSTDGGAATVTFVCGDVELVVSIN